MTDWTSCGVKIILSSSVSTWAAVNFRKYKVKVLDRPLLILGPSCLNVGRAVLKNMGRVVLVRDFIGPSGLVRVVFGPSCL